MSSTLRSYASKSAPQQSSGIKCDINSIRYTTPDRRDMVVLLAFFNPANSIRIIQNLYTVKQFLELANIPVYIGEVAYDTKPFVLQASPTVYQYRTSSIMFYKENIMAQLLRHLPETYTKVVLLDADILFVDTDWYRKVSEALDVYDVVQPYRTALQLDISFNVLGIKHSILSSINVNPHEGYAWAFQRSWLTKNPLFEYALIGGGDTVVYNSLSQYQNVSNIYSHDVYTTSKCVPSTSYVDIEIVHLPHGILQNRQYVSRYNNIISIMKKLSIMRLSDAVYRTPDGIFEWKHEYRSYINNELYNYFAARNDDGI